MTDNIVKKEREDYSLSQEFLDREYFRFLEQIGRFVTTADDLKRMAVTDYFYTVRNYFELSKNEPLIGKIEFPPTFDEIVDGYIETIKGSKPTFSYKEVIEDIEEASKREPLGLFR